MRESQTQASSTVLVTLVGVACSVLIAGCNGLVNGVDGPGASGSGKSGEKQVPLECALGVPQAGVTEIYRLTPTQYRNAIADLTGAALDDFDLDEDTASIASERAVRRWSDASKVAAKLGDWTERYLSCDIANGDDACGKEFALKLAARAFRRALVADEEAWLRETWDQLPAGLGFSGKMLAVARVVTQAPQFLYLYPDGAPVEESPHGLRALDGPAIATRLSFFLWDGPPDDALIAAAADGTLGAPDGIRAQAERLLDDDRAKPVFHQFMGDWLELNGNAVLPTLEDTPKDGEALGDDWNEGIRAAMRTELEAFIDDTIDRGGGLEELLTSTRAYVNGPLATLYGVTDGPTSASEWKWVDLDPNERAGVLTRAATLTVHASQKAESPIRRGVFMLRNVLCFNQPPPPPNVDDRPVDVAEANADVLSVRNQTTARTQGAECQTCHDTINHLGFAFEHYDAIGRYQTEDPLSGESIDSSGVLAHAGDEADGTVADAVKLSERLTGSDAAKSCITQRWFQIALHRSPVDLDACSLEAIDATLTATPSLKELLLAIVTSDAFVHVNHGPDNQPGE